VSEAPDHIACQSSTQSEIVVPVLTPDDRLLAVLDVDSDTLGALDEMDREHLEALCQKLGEQFGGE
jgi:GAF domain-containing protein